MLIKREVSNRIISGLVLGMFLIFILNACNTNEQAQSSTPDQVREVSSTSFVFEVNTVPLRINYFSLPEVDLRNEKITNMVIVVHGTSRNPFTYFTNMKIAAAKAGALDQSLIVSPGFIMEKDLDENRDILNDSHIFWTNNGWKQGDPSVLDSETNSRTECMSSFEVMDRIVMDILLSDNFPNIEQIVIAGNSAGGQFVNRYLGSNLIHKQVKESYGIEIKYMIAAPSSYTYLTPERPVIGYPGKYYTPSDTLCNNSYNQYKYGLENMNEYMEKTGAEKIREQYGQRQVAYFVGALDNDPDASSLDKTCQALLQGRERKERAELFTGYLKRVYGKEWILNVVPDAAHDHAKMFASEEGQKYLFN